MRTEKTETPAQIIPEQETPEQETPEGAGTEGAGPEGAGPEGAGTDQESDLVFMDSAISESLPKDVLDMCRANIGRQVLASQLAKKLKKTPPQKTNIHSFAWQLNNKLSNTEPFTFGYSTKGGLFVTIKPIK